MKTMETLNDNEDLQRHAPFLAGLPKADPFVVPDGFFERFPHQVQVAISAQQPATTPAWYWWKRMSIAFPVVGLLCLGAWYLLGDNGPDEAPMAEITPLTDGELDGIDDIEVLAAFDETDITPEELGEVVIELNDDELLAYLENDDTDITDLITDIE